MSSRKTQQQRLGRRAERLAERKLTAQGLTLVRRNYACRFGEIDLVMRDQQTLVFVEVRVRNHPRFGNAAASVTHHKQQRLIRAARHYLATTATSSNVRCRFDVVAVSTAHFDHHWIKNAFEVTA